jgi:hypothetical protein
MSNALTGYLKSIPLNRMSISDSCVLAVKENLHDVRAAVNAARLQRWGINEGDVAFLRYLVGRLHGSIFAFSNLLIYQAGSYEQVAQITDAAMQEADFLTGEYLHRSAS